MTQTENKKTLTNKEKMTYHNEVVFTGRLGADPEMIYTNSGKAKTTFSLAVNQGKDKKAMWLNVVCWQDLAEAVNEATIKGALVTVTGRLTQRKWESRYYHDVVASQVEVHDEQKATPKRKQVEEADDLGELDDHPF